MIQAKCIKKFRDNNEKIYGYRLIDMNGNTQDIVPDELKSGIKNGMISVSNLKLTSDNRLIDVEESNLKDTKIFPTRPTSNSGCEDIIYKTCNKLGFPIGENTPEFSGSIVEFESGKINIFGNEYTLYFEFNLTSNAGSVMLSGNLVEVTYADYKYMDQVDRINKLLSKMRSADKLSVNELIKLCREMVEYSDGGEAHEIVFCLLLKEYAKELNIGDKLKHDLSRILNKYIDSNKEAFKKSIAHLQEINAKYYNYSITNEDVIYVAFYCIAFGVDISEYSNICDPTSIVMIRDNLR